MSLLEYIKKNFATPNVEILRNLGASEALIDYLVYTPNNTNLNIVPQLIDEKQETGLIAKTFENAYITYNADGTIEKDGDIISFVKYEDIKEIIENHENYTVFAEFGDKKFEMPYKVEDIYKMFWLDVTIDGDSYTAYFSWDKSDTVDQVSIGVENLTSGSYEPISIETKIYVEPKN